MAQLNHNLGVISSTRGKPKIGTELLKLDTDTVVTWAAGNQNMDKGQSGVPARV